MARKKATARMGKAKTASAAAKKRPASAAEKKRTASAAAKKRTASAAAKKRTASTAAKKRTASTAAKKRTASTAAKKRTAAVEPGRQRKLKGDALDRVTVQCIRSTAAGIHAKLLKGHKPELKFPTRSLKNVRYDKKVGYFELGRGRKTRTLTVNTVKGFAQTLRLMAVSKGMVETDDFATKREAYYVSKNWGDAKFREQPESDSVLDDIESMFSLEGVSREQLRFIPEEHGGAVAGELVVIDRDSETGEAIEIDCTRFGSGAYTIPASVEHLRFRTDARFILAIETGGMFQRLNYHKFWKSARCILVEMGGVPTRATRRFIRRLADSKKIPVFAFTDCDPYGFSNIYRTLKVGSGNAAHINRFFCVPQARFLGVTPQDIIDFKLQDATHELTDQDVKRANDALKNDPFFQSHGAWRKAIGQLLKMGCRAEQQALAKWGLNHVMEEYLPRKLAEATKFLP